MRKKYYIDGEFNINGHIGKIVRLKTWCSGKFEDCQLLTVALEEEPSHLYRAFKWPDGTINRVTKIPR